MSPLWRNELRIALLPDRVIVLGLGKGLRREVLNEAVLPCGASAGGPSWRAPLAALETWLMENKLAKADVSIVISNQFVRYALMPFSEEVLQPEEEEVLARVILEKIYGDAVHQWEVRVGEGGYGEQRMIVALDAELMEALNRVLETFSLRLTSAKPYLICAINGLCEQLQEEDCLFAVAESGQLVTVACREGRPFAVRKTLQGGRAEELPGLLQREAMLSGLDAWTAPIYLHVAGKPDFELPSGIEMDVRLLRREDKNSALPMGEPFVEMILMD